METYFEKHKIQSFLISTIIGIILGFPITNFYNRVFEKDNQPLKFNMIYGSTKVALDGKFTSNTNLEDKYGFSDIINYKLRVTNGVLEDMYLAYSPIYNGNIEINNINKIKLKKDISSNIIDTDYSFSQRVYFNDKVERPFKRFYLITRDSNDNLNIYLLVTHLQATMKTTAYESYSHLSQITLSDNKKYLIGNNLMMAKEIYNIDENKKITLTDGSTTKLDKFRVIKDLKQIKGNLEVTSN